MQLSEALNIRRNRRNQLRHVHGLRQFYLPQRESNEQQDRLDPLVRSGAIRELAYHRGFIEHVRVSATQFPSLADELFRAAPIRFLTLDDAIDGLAQFANSQHAERIRGITVQLTDELVEVLIASPYLRKLAFIQTSLAEGLTPHGLERLVTAPTLIGLSALRIDEDPLPHWQESVAASRGVDKLWHQRIRSIFPAPTLRDTWNGATLYPSPWIAEIEAKHGLIPALHPERFYGLYSVEPERVALSPIASDFAVMALRGSPVPDPGSRPSLAERWDRGVCPLCGGAVLEQALVDPYSGVETLYPDYFLAVCQSCGTEYWLKLWPQAQTSGRQHGAYY